MASSSKTDTTASRVASSESSLTEDSTSTVIEDSTVMEDSLDLDSNDGLDDDDDAPPGQLREHESSEGYDGFEPYPPFDSTYDNQYDEYEQGAYYEDDFQPNYYEPAPQPAPQFRAGMCVVSSFLFTDGLHVSDMNDLQVCKLRPCYTKRGKSYPTCGLTCAATLDSALNNMSQPQRGGYSLRRGGRATNYSGRGRPPPPVLPIPAGAYFPGGWAPPFSPATYPTAGPSIPIPSVGHNARTGFQGQPRRGGYYASARGALPGRGSRFAQPARPVRQPDPCVVSAYFI